MQTLLQLDSSNCLTTATAAGAIRDSRIGPVTELGQKIGFASRLYVTNQPNQNTTISPSTDANPQFLRLPRQPSAL